MRVAGRKPVGTVLPASGRECGEPEADAFDRRRVYAAAVLRKPQDDAVAPGARSSGGPPSSAAADGIAGPGSRVPETEAKPAGRGTQALPVLAERRVHHAGQTGVGH